MKKLVALILASVMMLISIIPVNAAMPWPSEFPVNPASGSTVVPYQIVYLHAARAGYSSQYVLVCSSTPISFEYPITNGNTNESNLYSIRNGSTVDTYRLDGSPGNFHWTPRSDYLSDTIFRQDQPYIRSPDKIVWSTQSTVLRYGTSEVLWPMYQPTYPYTMKFKNENGIYHEYAFDQKPVYFGAGANWMIIQANGPYKEDGNSITASNTILKIQNLVSKNFDIKDAQGNTVIGAPKGTKVRRISGVTPSDIWLDSTYSKVQWYLTSSNTPIITYTDQNSITNTAKAAFDILDGFVVLRIVDATKWQIATNGWYISDPTTPSVPPSEYEEVETKPDRSNYEEGIYGTIAYTLDMIGYYIKMPFVFIASLLQNIVTMLTSVVQWTAGVGVLLGQMFSFLPVEVRTIIVGLFSVTSIAVVYKFMRK